MPCGTWGDRAAGHRYPAPAGRRGLENRCAASPALRRAPPRPRAGNPPPAAPPPGTGWAAAACLRQTRCAAWPGELTPDTASPAATVSPAPRQLCGVLHPRFVEAFAVSITSASAGLLRRAHVGTGASAGKRPSRRVVLNAFSSEESCCATFAISPFSVPNCHYCSPKGETVFSPGRQPWVHLAKTPLREPSPRGERRTPAARFIPFLSFLKSSADGRPAAPCLHLT